MNLLLPLQRPASTMLIGSLLLGGCTRAKGQHIQYLGQHTAVVVAVGGPEDLMNLLLVSRTRRFRFFQQAFQPVLSRNRVHNFFNQPLRIIQNRFRYPE